MASENAAAQDVEKRTAVCEIHGDYQQNVVAILGREMRSHCPKCMAERQAEDDAKRRTIEDYEARKALTEKLRASLVPKRFADRSFESYEAASREQKKALSTCIDYAHDFDAVLKAGRCLILSGKPGTGKTHLAASIANYLNANTSHTAAYRTVPAMLMHIKASYDSREYSEEGAIKAMVSPSLLVLDEIGATKASEFELAMLFNVINGRYEEKLPTVVISNLPPTELADSLGERTLDRLREGGGIALAFNWESARKGITQ